MLFNATEGAKLSSVLRTGISIKSRVGVSVSDVVHCGRFSTFGAHGWFLINCFNSVLIAHDRIAILIHLCGWHTPPLSEPNAALIWLQAANAQLQPITLLDVAMWFLERAVAHLAQVQQPFQAIVQRDERAKVHDIRNNAFDLFAFMIAVHCI